MEMLRKMTINLVSEPPKYETLSTAPCCSVPVSLPCRNGARSGGQLQTAIGDLGCRTDNGDLCTGNAVPATGEQPEQLLGTAHLLVPGVGT